MNDEAFWAVLDRGMIDDAEVFAVAVQDRLETLAADEIEAFCHRFTACLDALYTWDLWAVVSILLGFCSDDGFEYFRCWLIAQGQDAVELALTDPERFVLSIDASRHVDLHYESLLYVGADAYEALTGEEIPLPPRTSPIEPSGERWYEDELPNRFPLACAIFR